MKKHLFPLAASLLLVAGVTAQPTTWTNCGTGSSATITWDGGGADEDWFTAANWSTNTVPDCNDNVVFNGTSSKWCRITANVATRDITVNAAYDGRLIIEGTSTLTSRDITIDGIIITSNSKGGLIRANNFTVNNNGLASLNNTEIFSNLTIGDAGYVSMFSNSYLNVGVFSMGSHAFFRAPQGFSRNPNAKVTVRTSFSMNKVNTFNNNEGLFEFVSSGNFTINLSSGTSQDNGRVVFHNLSVKANGSSDNFEIVGGDSVVVSNKLSILDGEFRGGGLANAWVIVEDTMEHNGIGDGGNQATYLFRGGKTCDLFLAVEDVSAASSTMNFDNSVVIWKGSASSIASRFAMNLRNGANVSFGDAVDVTQKKNLTVASGATINLPNANTFSLENANLSVAGTIIPGSGTFAFTGNSTSTYDLIGGTKDFYNVIINKGTAGTADPGNLEPLEASNGGDVMRVKNDLTFDEADWRNGDNTSIIEVEGDWIVTANNGNNTNGSNNAMIVRFVGNGNSNLQSDGRITGDLDIQVNKDAASNSVTVTGSLQDIGNNSSQITLTKGKLAFDGTKNATLRCSDEPGLIVSADGQLVAPDDDELTIIGSWNFAGQASLDAQSSTLNLAGSDADNFTHNNSTVTVNNIKFSTSARKHWGANAAANSDGILVKGNFEISHIGVRVRYVTVTLEGNFSSIAATTNRSELEELIFSGANNQTITCGDADEVSDGVEINKSGGKVTMGANLSVNRLELTAGNLVTGSYQLIVTGINAVVGGSSSSFVDGKLRRVTGNALSAGLLFPIGKSNAYRPVRVTNSGVTNSWDAEYFAADPTSVFGTSFASPLDAVSSTEYWTLTRNTGSVATLVDLSTNGNSFADANTRVVRWTGSTWSNMSSAGASAGFVNSIATISATGTYNFTLGSDNPAPINLVNSEQVSGLEIATNKNQQQVEQVAAQKAVAFTVFPNPVVETLNFSLSGADKGSVVLSDMSGKVLGVFNVAETRSISMRNLSAGVYFVTYTDGVNRIAQRVVRN